MLRDVNTAKQTRQPFNKTARAERTQLKCMRQTNKGKQAGKGILSKINTQSFFKKCTGNIYKFFDFKAVQIRQKTAQEFIIIINHKGYLLAFLYLFTTVSAASPVSIQIKKTVALLPRSRTGLTRRITFPCSQTCGNKQVYLQSLSSTSNSQLLLKLTVTG